MGRMHNARENRLDARYFRFVAFVPLGWIVLFSLVPDFAMRITGHSTPWLSAVTWGIGLLLICGVVGYIVTRVHKERYVARSIFAGIALLIISESFRISVSLGIGRAPSIHPWFNELRAIDNLLNGLGLVLVALAFLHAIIEMMASRQELLAEHAQLSSEVARRKQAESSLHERDVLLRGIGESALDAIVVMDNAGLVSYWNPSAERLLGYRSEEILGKSVHGTLAPPLQRKEYERGTSLWQHTGRGPVVGRIMLLKAERKDGSEIDIELSVSSVEISGQWHAIGIIRDVSDRNELEKALRENEQRFRIAVECANDFVYERDIRTGMAEFFGGFEASLGYAAGEFPRTLEGWIERIHPDDLPHVLKTIQEDYQRDGHYNIEYRLRKKDGSYADWWDRGILLRDVGGNPTRSIGAASNVTEQRRTEELLRASEARYRSLFDQAVDGIMIMSPDGQELIVNHAFARMHGYESPAEMRNLRLPDLDTPESKRFAEERLRRLMSGEALTFNVEHFRKDGRRVPLEVSCNLIDLGGKKYLLGFHHDITERKQAESLVEEHRAKMVESARLSSLGTMAGGVAHEINNPLAVIAGCAEQLDHLALDSGTAPAMTKRLAGMIRRNASRIQHIVQGLRELSRDGTGDPFVLTPVVDIISDVLELCQERFRLHGICIENRCSDASILIECRPSQICQVMLNLLNNSFHAVAELSERWVNIDVLDLGSRIEIAVSDSGSGIPKDIADHIFTPFFTTKFDQHGLGLGLSISRSVVETHHGEMTLDPSCPNTRFIMHLPKQQPCSDSGNR